MVLLKRWSTTSLVTRCALVAMMTMMTRRRRRRCDEVHEVLGLPSPPQLTSI